MIHPDPRSGPVRARAPEARLAEAVGLALAIDLDVVHADVVPLSRARPATLFGSGTVERLEGLVRGHEVAVVVVDGILTPVQQRNLEKAWTAKVIDRTGLILEIFGARARTREGSLQVELASLSYQRSRLVRSWTHLERQRGGFGFLGGPGESQIETDRRLIDERIVKLKRELSDVRRTRELHRAARRRVPYPIVALVGYTNAGKSTLFNRLTRADVFAEDQLFATLDPTMRGLALPSGRRVILSDTVGFVSELPHELVVAFHATLEEVREADVLLHVRDAAHPDTDAQRDDVMTVLAELGFDDHALSEVIEVLNKTDLLDDDARETLANRIRRSAPERPLVPISARTGAGLADLLAEVEARLGRDLETRDYTLAHGSGAALAWLYRHGEVVARRDDDDGIHVTVRLAPTDVERFERGEPDLPGRHPA